MIFFFYKYLHSYVYLKVYLVNKIVNEIHLDKNYETLCPYIQILFVLLESPFIFV